MVDALQYRWTGELSRAAQARLKEALQQSLNRFGRSGAGYRLGPESGEEDRRSPQRHPSHPEPFAA